MIHCYIDNCDPCPLLSTEACPLRSLTGLNLNVRRHSAKTDKICKDRWKSPRPLFKILLLALLLSAGQLCMGKRVSPEIHNFREMILRLTDNFENLSVKCRTIYCEKVEVCTVFDDIPFIYNQYYSTISHCVSCLLYLSVERKLPFTINSTFNPIFVLICVLSTFFIVPFHIEIHVWNHIWLHIWQYMARGNKRKAQV